jgi:hypothetical protein
MLSGKKELMSGGKEHPLLLKLLKLPVSVLPIFSKVH